MHLLKILLLALLFLSYRIDSGQNSYTNRTLTDGMSAQFSVSMSTTPPSPATVLDYQVASQNGNIVFSSITCSISSEQGEGVRRVYTVTGAHIGNSLYVHRVGICKNFLDTNANTHTVLLAEVDLDEPIYVNPHESFMITILWNEG